MRRWKTRLGAVGLLVAVSACEVVDRARSRDAAGEEERVDAGATGLTLNLETPGSVRMGEQAAIHLAVTNGADTAVAGVRLELLLPPWMEPLVPEPAGTEVNLVASDEGTRLAYPFTTRPLQPGESRTIVQRIRAPAPSAGAANVFPGGVRASLAGLDGRPLGAQVESQLAIDTTRVGVPDSASAPGTDPTVSGDGVGAVRLGMSAAEIRRAAPGARDTTWTTEGTSVRGIAVSAGGGRLAAELNEGRVSRIELRDRAPRTAEGLGVGSRVQQLRARYGQSCADVREGEVVAWFPAKPGITWVLDTPAPSDAERVRAAPDRIPNTATVTRVLVHGENASCP